MNKSRTRDKIDEELSKTYFGNTLRTIDLKGVSLSAPKNSQAPAEKDHKKRSSRKFRSFLVDAVVVMGRLRPFFITVALLAGLVLSIIWFLAHERLIFSVNLETTPVNVAQDVQKAVVPGIMTTSLSLPFPEISGKETVLYDFENGDDGWEIPFWATEKPDHVAVSLESVSNISSSGKSSARIYAEFIPGIWSAALIENQRYLDLSEYRTISAKIYLPPDATDRLRGEIILTTSDTWNFVEMSHTVKLIPGKWTTITADISEGSIDWKRTKIDDAFRKDIRKIALRITSNGMPYSGFAYIDEVKVSP
ncbi:MAG: hypothetical protein ABH862_01560 [Candidatus Omnitrophota bacterium]